MLFFASINIGFHHFILSFLNVMTFNADVFPFFTLHPTLLLLMSFPLSLFLSYSEELNSIWHNLFHLNLISLICSGELESERKAKTKRGQGPERDKVCKSEKGFPFDHNESIILGENTRR